MTTRSPAIEVAPLGVDAPLETMATLDRVLASVARALVDPGEALEPVSDRARDAASDPHRLVLVATVEGEPVGLLDGTLHSPWPGTLAVAQLAVSRAHRFRGLGRALVESALASAAERDPPPVALSAAVRAGQSGALAFWEALGLVEVAREGTVRQLLRDL